MVVDFNKLFYNWHFRIIFSTVLNFTWPQFYLDSLRLNEDDVVLGIWIDGRVLDDLDRSGRIFEARAADVRIVPGPAPNLGREAVVLAPTTI